MWRAGPTVPGVPDQNGLLHAAVQEDNAKVVKFLLKHGADANARMRSSKQLFQQLDSEVNHCSEMREILYRYRSASFSATVAQSLQPLKVVPGLQPGPRCRSLSSVSELCVAPGSRAFRGDQLRARSPTPMHVAAVNCNREILELLLGHGAEVNAEMEGDYTPLVISILLKQLDIAELLINHGANVNSRLKNGKTPLHLAVKSKQLEMVQLLLSSGANPNASTEHGVTALHIAVERKLQDVVELLLKSGSDVNAKTKTGVTPLHCAAVKGQREITEMILNYGGDVSVIVKKGKIDVTPLLWVTERERNKITDLLLGYLAKSQTSGFYGRFFKKIWKQLSGGVKC